MNDVTLHFSNLLFNFYSIEPIVKFLIKLKAFSNFDVISNADTFLIFCYYFCPTSPKVPNSADFFEINLSAILPPCSSFLKNFKFNLFGGKILSQIKIKIFSLEVSLRG